MKEHNEQREYIEPTIDFLSNKPANELTKEFLTKVFADYREEIILNCIGIVSESGIDATGRGVDELFEYLVKGIK